MKVDRALEIAIMAAEDDNPWSESLKALADEVIRLQAHIARASRRVLDHGFADELTEFCAGLDVTKLPPGVYDKLFMAKEHIKGLKRMVAFGEHRVRDTRKGEWPEEGQRMQVWDECEWSPWIHVDNAEGFDGRYWLPAPPPPEES